MEPSLRLRVELVRVDIEDARPAPVQGARQIECSGSVCHRLINSYITTVSFLQLRIYVMFSAITQSRLKGVMCECL